MWALLEWLVVILLVSQVAIPCIFPTIQFFWVFRKSTKKMEQAAKQITNIKEEEILVDIDKTAKILRENLETKKQEK